MQNVKCELCEEVFNNAIDIVRHYTTAHKLRTAKKDDQSIIAKSYSLFNGTSPYKCKFEKCNCDTMYRGADDKKHDKGYDVNFCINHFRGVSYQHLLIKYGKEAADIKWKEYKDKQALTNTFEYKQQKFGWTREQFDQYNNSRAVTIDNMIARYGEVEGKRKFEEYCKLQSYAGSSLQYFIDKYGEDEGKVQYERVNKSKAITVDNLKKHYDEETAIKKYIQHVNSRKVLYSKGSQELFDSLTEIYSNECSKIYYATKNKEFAKYCPDTKKYYYFDYCILDKKLIIEYNGLKFHCKPGHESAWKNPYDSDLTADAIKQRDYEKCKFAESLGFTVLVVWEDDYENDKQKTVSTLKEIIDGL